MSDSSERKRIRPKGTVGGQKPQEPVSRTGLQILTATTLTSDPAAHVQGYFNTEWKTDMPLKNEYLELQILLFQYLLPRKWLEYNQM